MSKPRIYNKSKNSDNQVKESLDTRIDKLIKKDIENYEKVIRNETEYNIPYKIPQGYTLYVSKIIASCRGGFI